VSFVREETKERKKKNRIKLSGAGATRRRGIRSPFSPKKLYECEPKKSLGGKREKGADGGHRKIRRDVVWLLRRRKCKRKNTNGGEGSLEKYMQEGSFRSSLERARREIVT